MSATVNAEQAAAAFASSFAPQFSGGLIVSVDIYADESGVGDPTGKSTGTHVAALAGFVAWREDWIRFCLEWQTKLDEYSVPCFNYGDWLYKRHKKDSPYYDWDEERLNCFLIELAQVAGKWTRFHIGGYFNLKKYHGLAPHAYPYLPLFRLFFASFLQEVNERWPLCRESFTFIFDNTTDKKWKHGLEDVFTEHANKDNRISEIRFRNDQMKEGLPLQAADMLVYRVRSMGEKKIHIGRPLIIKEQIDRVLFGKSMPSRFNYLSVKLDAIRARTQQH